MVPPLGQEEPDSEFEQVLLSGLLCGVTVQRCARAHQAYTLHSCTGRSGNEDSELAPKDEML